MANQITGHYTAGGYSARNEQAALDLPELFWRMNETSGTKLFDSTGNNNAGTLAGTFTLGATGKDVDSAITFNGSTGRVTSSKAGHGGDLAVECWVNTQSSPSGDRFLFGIRGGSSVRAYVWQPSGTNTVKADWRPDAGHFIITSDPVSVSASNWHHVVFQFISSTHKLELWVDNVLGWSTTHDVTAGDPVAISGGDGFGTFNVAAEDGGANFSGSTFQKAAMYSTALSSGRVGAHYAGTSATTYSKTLTATASGSPAMTRAATFLKSLSATAGSTATLTEGASFPKTLTAIAGSTASLTHAPVTPSTLSATAGSAPSLSFTVLRLYSKTLTAVAGHVATMGPFSYAKTLSATAGSSASLDAGLVGYVPRGVQVDVYAPDNTTMLATLEGAREVNFQDQLNACGSGTFRINVNDPKATAANLARGNIIKVRLDGQHRFSYFIEENSWVVLDSAGKGTEDVTVAGRGLLSYLERAIVYPHGWPTGDGVGYQYAGAHLAKVLVDFVQAAQARGALPRMGYNFTATHDSIGAAWTDSNALQVQDGVSLLDLVTNQLVPMGLNVRMGLDLVLHAHQVLGVDRSSTVILRGGRHIGDGQAQLSEHAAPLRSRLVVAGSNNLFAEVNDATLESDAQVGRREGYLNASGAADVGTLTSVGNAELQFIKAGAQPLQVPIVHGDDPGNYQPYADYLLGDTLMLDMPGTAYTGTKLPLVAMTITQRPDGDYTVAADFQAMQIDPLVRLREQIANSSSPSGGGSLGGVGGFPLSPNTPFLDTGNVPTTLGAQIASGGGGGGGSGITGHYCVLVQGSRCVGPGGYDTAGSDPTNLWWLTDAGAPGSTAAPFWSVPSADYDPDGMAGYRTDGHANGIIHIATTGQYLVSLVLTFGFSDNVGPAAGVVKALTGGFASPTGTDYACFTPIMPQGGLYFGYAASTAVLRLTAGSDIHAAVYDMGTGNSFSFCGSPSPFGQGQLAVIRLA